MDCSPTHQVIPSQPTAKNELKTNRNTAATMPRLALPVTDVVPAKTAIDAACPAAPNSMSFRRPKRSMVKMATHEAMKYSVPFRAASSLLKKGESPMLFSKIVAA